MSETPRTDIMIEWNKPHVKQVTELVPADFARTLERALARQDALLREVDGRISNVLRGVPMRDLDEWLEQIRHELIETTHSASQGRKK